MPEPGHEAVARQHGNEHEPEPQEDVDLFIKQVDWKHALDRVALDVLHLPNVKIAQRNSGKAFRRRPFFSHYKILHHLESVDVVVCGEEGIQHEQLSYRVGYIHDLHEEIHGHQVVPVSLATQQREFSRQDVSQLHAAVVSALSLVVKTTVYVTHDVFDCPDPDVRALVLGVGGQTDDPVDVDAGLAVQQAPDDARDVEHERLD